MLICAPRWAWRGRRKRSPRANLFILPLDGQREWYRYHHLFADVLQKQLLHAHPGLAPDLHQRAANWFEAHGLVDEALTHTLQTDDPALPLDLVERHALETILQGRIATAARWLDSLSADALLTRPRLCLDRAWVLSLPPRPKLPSLTWNAPKRCWSRRPKHRPKYWD